MNDRGYWHSSAFYLILIFSFWLSITCIFLLTQNQIKSIWLKSNKSKSESQKLGALLSRMAESAWDQQLALFHPCWTRWIAGLIKHLPLHRLTDYVPCPSTFLGWWVGGWNGRSSAPRFSQCAVDIFLFRKNMLRIGTSCQEGCCFEQTRSGWIISQYMIQVFF